jgi:hypothetical protein
MLEKLDISVEQKNTEDKPGEGKLKNFSELIVVRRH